MKKKTKEVGSVKMMALKDLVPYNEAAPPRHTPSQIRAMAASVKNMGILEPLLGRPHPDKAGKVQIVAGHGRWAAAAQAGHKEVPVAIAELDDAKATEVAFAENHQRLNFHPLKEAEVITKMLDAGWDVESIATRHGRSPGWVARRAHLTNLAEPLRGLTLIPGSFYSRLPDGILERLARLPASTQQALYEQMNITAKSANMERWECPEELQSVHDLNRALAEFTLSLAHVPWKLDDETVDPEAGACTMCPKRKGYQLLLWTDDEDDSRRQKKQKSGDTCLDPTCFDRKTAAALRAKIAIERTRYPNLILMNAGGRYSATSGKMRETFGNDVLDYWKVTTAKAKDPDARRALVVAGPGLGQTRWVKVTSSPPRTSRPQKAAGHKPAVIPLKDRRARLTNRRRIWIINQIADLLREMLPPAKPLEFQEDQLPETLALVCVFGTIDRDFSAGSSTWELLSETRRKKSIGDLHRELRESVYEVWITRLRSATVDTLKSCWADAEAMAPFVNIDLADLISQAAEKFPEPKFWAGLKADGTPKKSGTSHEKDKPSGKAPPASASTKKRDKKKMGPKKTGKKKTPKKNSEPAAKAPRDPVLELIGMPR